LQFSHVLHSQALNRELDRRGDSYWGAKARELFAKCHEKHSILIDGPSKQTHASRLCDGIAKKARGSIWIRTIQSQQTTNL
jgi:hypothetical protein